MNCGMSLSIMSSPPKLITRVKSNLMTDDLNKLERPYSSPAAPSWRKLCGLAPFLFGWCCAPWNGHHRQEAIGSMTQLHLGTIAHNCQGKLKWCRKCHADSCWICNANDFRVKNSTTPFPPRKGKRIKLTSSRNK